MLNCTNHLVLLVILPFILIFPNVSPDLSLKAQEYEFDITGINGENIYDLFLGYDFEIDEGTFNFKIKSEKMSTINILIPPQLKVFGFNVSNIDGMNISSCEVVNKNSSLQCSNLESEKELIFLINLTSKNKTLPFYPNGVFYFRPGSEKTSARYFKDTHSYDLLRFDFGDKYRCSERCFLGEYGKSNLTYNANKNFFRTYVLVGIKVI